ncbi:MAG: hypothetical protein ABIO24_11950, partial [Saprospiraceae bacterium]
MPRPKYSAFRIPYSAFIWPFLLLALVQNTPFFWDTVQLGSKHAHFFYENGLHWAALPPAIDSGHPPVFGFYLAILWSIFGKTLPVSHWAMLPFLLGIVALLLRLGRRFGKEKWVFWLLPLVLLDPVLAGQMTLISPDVVLVFFFLLAMDSLLGKKPWLFTLAILGLCAVSMRGMMTAGTLFVWNLGIIRIRNSECGMRNLKGMAWWLFSKPSQDITNEDDYPNPAPTTIKKFRIPYSALRNRVRIADYGIRNLKDMVLGLFSKPSKEASDEENYPRPDVSSPKKFRIPHSAFRIRKFRIPYSAFRILIPYLPGFAFAAGFLYWHQHATGWTGYHPGSSWAPAFERVAAAGMWRNSLVLGWRWLDFGRILEWLVVGGLIWNFWRRKIVFSFSQKAVLFAGLPFLLVCCWFLLSPSAILYHNLSAHRYFLAGYLVFHLLVFQGIVYANWTDRVKKGVFIALIISMATGNLWIYPDGISMDWDSTLAHQPYHQLRAGAMAYLDRQEVGYETVGSAFPNLNTGENLL